MCAVWKTVSIAEIGHMLTFVMENEHKIGQKQVPILDTGKGSVGRINNYALQPQSLLHPLNFFEVKEGRIFLVKFST